MRPVLPAALLDRAVARYPLPVADAVAALAAAEGVHEARDRVVEVFRATLRWLALLALAARTQYGSPGRSEGAEVAELLGVLAHRALTDGQWVALLRGIGRSWKPGEGPLPGLSRLVARAEFGRAVDGLLTMRRTETVAHGGTGNEAELTERLERRIPQLIALLESSEEVWSGLRLVVPRTASGGWSLMGCTPPRGHWRAIPLPDAQALAPGEPVLVDDTGAAVLALAPFALVRRAAAEQPPELFALEGPARRGVLYVALPSMTEHTEGAERWLVVARALSLAEQEETVRPYRGFDSFGPEHAALFFGRETQSEALAARVRHEPLVVVTGPSGAGKTSLLRAGVLPRLTDHQLVEFHPGADPCGALARCLGQLVGEDPGVVQGMMARSPEAVGQGLARWSAQSRRPLIILVDQAEEMFTRGANTRQRLLFARALAASLGTGDVHLVLAVREDHLAQLASLEPLHDLAARSIELVSTPDEDALTRALIEPVLSLGYRFDDLTLVARMVAAAGSEPSALALLQFCADQLWEARDRRWRRLTTDAYTSLGGVEGALAAHAERTLLALPPSQQATARALLLRLLTTDGRRTLASRDDLLAAAPHHGAAAVLERLVSARIVIAREQAEGDAFELAHQALLDRWPRLQAWREQGRGDQFHLDALRHAARAWDDRGRPRARLWRGEVLAEHRLWSHHTDAIFAPRETEFLAASESEQRRSDRWRFAASLGALATVLVTISSLAVLWIRAEKDRHEAAEARLASQASLDRAAAESDRFRRVQFAAEARRHESLGHTAEAAALLRAARELAIDAGSPDLDEISRLGDDLGRLVSLGDTPWELPASQGTIRALESSTDGRWLAARYEDHAQYFSLASFEEITTPPDVTWEKAPGSPGPPSKFLPASSDRPSYALASFAGDTRQVSTSVRGAYLLDRDGHELQRLEEHGRPVVCAAFSHDGELVATGSSDGQIWLYNGRSGTPLQALHGPGAGVEALVFTADGQWLAAGPRGGDGALLLWKVRDLVAPQTLRGHADSVLSLAWSPHGDLLATASRDHSVRLWSTAGGALQRRLDHGAPVFALAFSPDGSRLATAARESFPHLWSVADGTSVSLPDHGGYSPALLFAPDGRLITSSVDRRLRVFDSRGAPLLTSGELSGVPVRLALAPDQQRLASLCYSTDVCFLDLSAVAAPSTPVHTGPGYPEATSAADNLLAAGATDGSASVWKAMPPSLVTTVRGHAGAILTTALSRSGQWLATGSSDHTAALWRLPAGSQNPALSDHGAPVIAAAFSPDEKLLATATTDGVVRIWNVYTGERLAVLAGHTGRVVALAWAPDGQHLASGSHDATVRLWPAAAWQPRGDPSLLLGGRTNVRVCRDSGALVAVLPRPAPEAIWAPADACRAP